MKTTKKRWSEMTTEELAEATKKFDDPNYNPPARRPGKRALAQLRRVQKRSASNRFRVALALEKDLVEQTDEYAAKHGVTFSQVVTDALRKLMQKRSA